MIVTNFPASHGRPIILVSTRSRMQYIYYAASTLPSYPSAPYLRSANISPPCTYPNLRTCSEFSYVHLVDTIPRHKTCEPLRLSVPLPRLRSCHAVHGLSIVKSEMSSPSLRTPSSIGDPALYSSRALSLETPPPRASYTLISNVALITPRSLLCGSLSSSLPH